MTAHRLLLVLLVACAPTSARRVEPPPPAAGRTIDAMSQGAVMFDDLGTHHREVATSSPEAQRYFDQGLRLLYGFNHDEAARSFAKAAALDPACAMCFWGVAFALGPNYNVPMLAGSLRARRGTRSAGRGPPPRRTDRRARADRGARRALPRPGAARPRGAAAARHRLRGRDARGREALPRRRRRAGAVRRGADGPEPVEAVDAGTARPRRAPRRSSRRSRPCSRGTPIIRARTTTTSTRSRRRAIRGGPCRRPSACRR